MSLWSQPYHHGQAHPEHNTLWAISIKHMWILKEKKYANKDSQLAVRLLCTRSISMHLLSLTQEIPRVECHPCTTAQAHHMQNHSSVTAWPCQGTGKLSHWRMISTKCISLPYHQKAKLKHNSDHQKSGALCGKPGTEWIKSGTVSQRRLLGNGLQAETFKVSGKDRIGKESHRRYPSCWRNSFY